LKTPLLFENTLRLIADGRVAILKWEDLGDGMRKDVLFPLVNHP
jgi:hypothetical protein